MGKVAGVDGIRHGWVAIIAGQGQTKIHRIAAVGEVFGITQDLDVVAVDIPIGLLDRYRTGGRFCDTEARQFLGKGRGSSVFPAPVRGVLSAETYEEACQRSKTSGPQGKCITKQTFAIVPKIREVDQLLRERPELRKIIREVHPEASFRQLANASNGCLEHPKHHARGREQRRALLGRVCPWLAAVEQEGRSLGVPTADVLDAAVACWSALRIASGEAISFPDQAPVDAVGLPMAIWT